MVKDFEINVPPIYGYDIYLPIDRAISRYVFVKNTGDESIKLRYNLWHVEKQRGVRGVLPRLISVDPGESKTIMILLDEPHIWGEPPHGGDMLERQEEDGYLGLRSIEEMEGEYPVTIEVNVFPAGDESKKKSVVLKHLVQVIPPNKLENTSVRGHIYDETGKPMPGIQVTLRGRSRIYRPTGKTDQKGYYEISCHRITFTLTTPMTTS